MRKINVFKGAKKIVALAMCGMLCIANVMSASAATTVKIYYGESKISETTAYKTARSYYIYTDVVKDYAGRNKYTSSISGTLIIHDGEGNYISYNKNQTVYSGYTYNPCLKQTYTDMYVSGFKNGKIQTNFISEDFSL